MKNPLKNTFKENPWLRFFSNKYVLISAFFIAWMLFLDNYSYWDQRVLDKQIEELETNKKYYQDEIHKDEEKIKLLNNSDEVERYAREKYYMKRDSEDIYIIEYQGDSISKSNI